MCRVPATPGLGWGDPREGRKRAGSPVLARWGRQKATGSFLLKIGEDIPFVIRIASSALFK